MKGVSNPTLIRGIAGELGGLLCKYSGVCGQLAATLTPDFLAGLHWLGSLGITQGSAVEFWIYRDAVMLEYMCIQPRCADCN